MSAASVLAYDDPMWGRLVIDRSVLLDALGKATKAVSEATHAARWLTADGYPINSAWADALGGLNSTLDALIDLLDVPEEPS